MPMSLTYNLILALVLISMLKTSLCIEATTLIKSLRSILLLCLLHPPQMIRLLMYLIARLPLLVKEVIENFLFNGKIVSQMGLPQQIFSSLI